MYILASSSDFAPSILAASPLPEPPPGLDIRALVEQAHQVAHQVAQSIEIGIFTPAIRGFLHTGTQVSRLKSGEWTAASSRPLLETAIPTNHRLIAANTLTVPGIGSDQTVTRERASNTGAIGQAYINCSYQKAGRALEVAKATRFTAELLLQESNLPLVLSGHSMGGGICHKVAHDIKRVLPDAPIGVVTYSTPLKPAASFFPRVAQLEKIFEKLEFDGHPSGLYPFVAMHGEKDLMVHQAAAKLPENGILHTVPGADHGAQFNTPTTSLRLRAAVRLAAHMASRSVKTSH